MAKTLSKAAITQAIQSDNAARKAKGDAKRAATLATKKAKADAEAALQAATRDAVAAEQAAKRDVNAEHAAYLKTMREDYEAGFEEGQARDLTFEQFLADNGVNPDGSAKAADDKAPREQTYFGPMLALKTARLTYVKAANGIQCNGDQLALVCGKHDRATVVTGLIVALNDAKIIDGLKNPYLHLNPGQQSMNLRNKARHALNIGTITMTAIESALNAAVTTKDLK